MLGCLSLDWGGGILVLDEPSLKRRKMPRFQVLTFQGSLEKLGPQRFPQTSTACTD